MERHWKFRNREYKLVTAGYGQYSLNGYHCTDSSIWDYATNDENLKKRGEARARAEAIIRRHNNENKSWHW